MTQFVALLLSMVSEAAVAAALVVALRWGNGVLAAAAAIIGTLATHWLAWWAIPHLEAVFGYAPAAAAVETAVVLAESIVYLFMVPLPYRRALATSLLANATSLGLGLAIYALNLA
jgi:hypothetical protein